MPSARLLDEPTLRAMSTGCGILGSGGGGDPRRGLLQALQAIETSGPVPLVDLGDLAPESFIMPCGRIGSPEISREKIPNGSEGARLREQLESLTGQVVAAIMPTEIGGSNGLVPISWAARMALPVVDADGMGRAFPEVEQVTMHLAGVKPDPCVITDERGVVRVFNDSDGHVLERRARECAEAMGGIASATVYSMSAAVARRATVRGSISTAIRIGEAVRQALSENTSSVLADLGGYLLVQGKIADLERRHAGGFLRGFVEVTGLGPHSGRTVRIDFQNENLVAREDETVLASVPDLISVVDTETTTAITTDRMEYGQRVSVIAIPCDPIWRTPAGLELAGPQAFAFPFDYVPVEALAHASA